MASVPQPAQRAFRPAAAHSTSPGPPERAMTRRDFTRLVTEVLDSLPEEFASRVANVEIVVADAPSRAQLRDAGLDPRTETLMGLYEGVPLADRGNDYSALPDRISIFYRPIVDACRSRAAIRDEIRTTLLHEIAHVFGIEDEDLDEWGY